MESLSDSLSKSLSESLSKSLSESLFEAYDSLSEVSRGPQRACLKLLRSLGGSLFGVQESLPGASKSLSDAYERVSEASEGPREEGGIGDRRQEIRDTENLTSAQKTNRSRKYCLL